MFITGICTATSFSGNGASLTNLNGSNIASGTVPVARIGTGTKDTTTFYRGDGTFQVVSTDLVGDSSPQLGGNLDTNDKNIVFADSDGGSGADNRAVFGASSDLQMYHNGGASVISHANTGDLQITNSSGDTWIASDGIVRISNNSLNGYMAKFDEDGAAELYHNGTKKFFTTADGAKLDGTGDVVLELNADTDNVDETHNPQLRFTQDGALNHLNIGIEGNANTQFTGSTGNFPYIHVTDAHSGALGLEIATNNIKRLTISSAGHTVPGADNTYNLGSPGLRWANIYSADIHCSNKGSKNDVDGSWGDFTIQEGESDLFLINNRSGKKYKFNLTEVN